MTDYEVYVPPVHGSHLFTVRIWQEELGDGEIEWRGKVQHVLNRETRYFRDWAMLSTCLLSLIESPISGIALHDQERKEP